MLYPHLNINGTILPKEKALIPVYDLGLLRGLGVFDFFRVLDGVPVFVEDHIERLENSLTIMGFQTGIDREGWMKLFYELIQTNSARQAGFRVVVTGGFSEDGYTIPEKKNIYLMLHHLSETDPSVYEKGIHLLTNAYRRETPSAKTTIYVQSMQIQPELKKTGAYEVLYHWDGQISECSRCNIFFIDRQGVLHTPGTGVLKGITRKQVLAIAQENHLPLRERTIFMHEIQEMAGCFLTATTKGVLPVVRIDDTIIGDGTVHPLARHLQDLYTKRTEAYLEQARLRHKHVMVKE